MFVVKTKSQTIEPNALGTSERTTIRGSTLADSSLDQSAGQGETP